MQKTYQEYLDMPGAVEYYPGMIRVDQELKPGKMARVFIGDVAQIVPKYLVELDLPLTAPYVAVVKELARREVVDIMAANGEDTTGRLVLFKFKKFSGYEQYAEKNLAEYTPTERRAAFNRIGELQKMLYRNRAMAAMKSGG